MQEIIDTISYAGQTISALIFAFMAMLPCRLAKPGWSMMEPSAQLRFIDYICAPHSSFPNSSWKWLPRQAIWAITCKI